MVSDSPGNASLAFEARAGPLEDLSNLLCHNAAADRLLGRRAEATELVGGGAGQIHDHCAVFDRKETRHRLRVVVTGAHVKVAIGDHESMVNWHREALAEGEVG